MSDINTAEMNRDELEATAKDLGVQFQKNTGDDTLRGRIDEKLGNAPAAPAQHFQNPAAPGESKQAKRYRIIIATNDQDSQPVQVGVNGRMYVIERGKEVNVPASVVENLNNAVQHVYDPKTMKESRVMAYPFQVLGEAEA